MAWKNKANPAIDSRLEEELRDAILASVSESACGPFVRAVVLPPAKNRRMHSSSRKRTRCAVDVLPRNKRALLWGCYKRFANAKPFGRGGFSQ